MVVKTARNAEYDVIGIIEYGDWIGTRNTLRPNRNKQEPEVHACLRAHLKKGIKDVLWSCGRSVVEYHSEDERITRFGVQADTTRMDQSLLDIMDDLAKGCPLRSAVDFGHGNNMTITGHLCMNRHYGGGYGNCLTSLLARKPEMWEIKKDGTPDKTRLCFALEEYCEERLAIIKEITQTGVDGICLDFLRQPPMLRYHPALTKAYKEKTGADPSANSSRRSPDTVAIDDVAMFMDWCRYRAGILTQFMRRVRKILRDFESLNRRNMPLSVRVTDDGFIANLISGTDTETWCKEGIVDCMITHPLQWIHGIWVHDVSPYVELGRRAGVKVIGGVNTYPVEGGWQMNPVCVAKKIKEQLDAGASGISMYETNDTVLKPELDKLLDAVHEYDRLEKLLNDRDWLQAWPVNGLNANCGMDNHSGFSRDLLSDL